jgi:hypothetical protein
VSTKEHAVPATLSPISVAAQAEAGTPYYGLVWLALASLAYTDEGATAIKNVGVDLPRAVGALPDPPAPPGFTQPAAGTWGHWRVDWGPAVDGDNSNLMYVASYREADSALPVFAVVSIRGTDTQERWKIAGLLRQLYEDLDVGHKVAWAQAIGDPSSPTVAGASNDEVAIAQGTCEGLKTLRRMTAPAPMPGMTGGVDVLTYVRHLATAHPGLPIVVTGHSLGACQATVMAAFLGDSLKAAGAAATLVPHAFAPPTAGTPAFAAKFEADFPGAHLWWNTLDVVPNAFQNIAHAPAGTPSLTNIHGFWKDFGGPAIDEVEKIALDAFVLVDHGYAQPAVNLQTLTGSVVVPSAAAGCENTWSAQLLIQHLPPQYHYLISTQLAGTVATYALPAYPGPCVQVPPAE